MKSRYALMTVLALAGLGSARYRVAETLPVLDPLLLLGASLILAGVACWKQLG
jgi:hypothetical protein